MRPLLALTVALSALACSAAPGDSKSGNSSGGGSTGAGSSGAASSGSSGGSSGGSASGGGTTGTSGAGSTGTGGSTGTACGTDTCTPCPGGYVSADTCLDDAWQCACALAPTGGSTGGSSGTSGGSTGGSGCGSDPCGACPPGCVTTDTCQRGGWLCGCGCGGIGGTNGAGSSAGNSSGGSSGGTGGATPCGLDGGAPTLVGSWSGDGTAVISFHNNSGGGGGQETEVVTATAGGVAFDPFFPLELVGCNLPWTLANPASASVVVGSTCADTAKGTWTFQSGTATVDSTGCVLTVQTAGTVVDPGSGAGTFTTSATLDLQ